MGETATKQPPIYKNFSRGHKTKGNTYKDRYVQGECPECGYHTIYKDEWTQTISYKCMKRSCRHQWFEKKIFPNQEAKKETTTV